MFTFEEYLIGWSVYLVAALGLLVVFWRLTRSIPWFYVKQSVRLAVATLLLVPAAIENASGFMAPAWIKGFLQLVFTGVEGFMPVGRGLVISLLLVFVVYLLLLIAQTLYRRWRVSHHSSRQTDS